MCLIGFPLVMLIIVGVLPGVGEPRLPCAAWTIRHRATERGDAFNDTRWKRQGVEIFSVKPGGDGALSVARDARSEGSLCGDGELIIGAHREHIGIGADGMPNHLAEVRELVIRNEVRVSPPVDAHVFGVDAESAREPLWIPFCTTEPSDSVRVPRSWHILKIVNKPFPVESNPVNRTDSDVKSEHHVIVRFRIVLQGVIKRDRICVFEFQRLRVAAVEHPLRNADFQSVVVLIIKPMPAEVAFC